ncbi:MAG: cation diffusion facilitator family transporter [Parvibaculales bacterium]
MEKAQEKSHHAGSLMRAISWASVLVGIVLIAAKFFAWMMTGSVAVLSSLLDSSLDLIASIGNFFAIRHSLTPADKEHRFGHGKAEALAALGQALFIFCSGVLLTIAAVRDFLEPMPTDKSHIAIIIIALSIPLTLALIAGQVYVARRTQSLAISADSAHYQGDLFLNLSVIISILLATQLGWVWAESLLAFIVAMFMFFSCFRIFMRSANHLMDHELNDERRGRIKNIILAHPKVVNMHDLRTRRAGIQIFIQCHIELDPDMSLVEAHNISDEVEGAVLKEFPNSEVLIHQDPAGHEDPSSLEKS